MISRLISSFIYFQILFTSTNQSINSTHESIDTGQTIVFREIGHIFTILQCRDRQTFNLPIFQCVSSKPFNIIEQSCVTTPFTCFDSNYFGLYCNISNNACQMAEQCSHNGICYPNNSLPQKFYCDCLPGYTGYDCSEDIRICKNNTCGHAGQCIVMDESLSYKDEESYDCQCIPGYDGSRCEHIVNMCKNITCENNGMCVYSHLSWECQCLGYDLYSGTYCENKSTHLKVLQILSKSFAYIAILAINAVCIFVITMDILKYVFDIDPVDRERQLIRLNKENKRFNKTKQRKNQRKIPVKLYYVA